MLLVTSNFALKVVTKSIKHRPNMCLGLLGGDLVDDGHQALANVAATNRRRDTAANQGEAGAHQGRRRAAQYQVAVPHFPKGAAAG